MINFAQQHDMCRVQSGTENSKTEILIFTALQDKEKMMRKNLKEEPCHNPKKN